MLSVIAPPAEQKSCCGNCQNAGAGRCTGGGHGQHDHEHDDDHEHHGHDHDDEHKAELPPAAAPAK